MKFRWPGFKLEPFEFDLPDLPNFDESVKEALAGTPDAEITIKKTTVKNTTTIVTTIVRRGPER